MNNLVTQYMHHFVVCVRGGGGRERERERERERIILICALTLSKTSPRFYVSAVQVFENTVGKGEIARNEQFLLFPQCFLHFLRDLSAMFIKLRIVVCKLLQFGRVQNLSFGNG